MSEDIWSKLGTINPALAEHLKDLADTASMSKCTRESHEAAKLDEKAWLSMEYVGIQESGPEYSLELRNCKCGSTLARRIVLKKP